MNIWDKDAIQYTDLDALKSALVGHQIVNTIGSGGDYPAEVQFVLDDGTVLVAHATDGGCACSNGCFSVKPGNAIRGAITNVELVEEAQQWGGDPKQIEPGSVGDGEATISVFVYGDLGKQLLIESEGGDNGYYGWGFWLNVERPEVAA